MGIISAAMAAAGDSGVQSMNQNIEQQNKQDILDKQSAIEAERMQQRADLELQKQKAILDYQEQAKNAPLQRLGIIAQAQMAKPVPVDPEPVTELTQASADALGLKDGIQGKLSDFSTWEKAADKIISDPQSSSEQKDHAKGLMDQMRKQLLAQKQATIDAVKGQMRSRTPDEALDAALNEAKVSDPQAYAAGVAGGLVPPKLTKIGPNESLIDNKGKVVFSNTAGAEAAERLQARKEAIVQKQIESNEKIAAAKLDAALSKNEVDPDTLESNAAMLANYELAPPTGFAAARPVAQQMLARAKELNPEFDAKNYKVMQNLDDKFKSGKQGDQIRSVSAAMEHLDLYKQLAEAQNNGSIPLFNRLAAKFAMETGSEIPKSLDVAASIVGPEIAKVMVPGGGGVHERDSYTSKFAVGNSPAQALGVADTYLGLMAGQLHGFARQYSYVPGANPDMRMEKFKTFLSPEAVDLLGKYGASSGSDRPPIKAPTGFGKPKNDQPAAAYNGGIQFLGFE